MPEIIILGGANGAGKTSAAPLLFKRYTGSKEFVNADEIARGLSPFNPERAAIAAGRLMITRMRELIRRKESFVVETTCSGLANVNVFQARKNNGWTVSLLFLWLRHPRYRSSASRVGNLHRHYLPLANTAAVYDNTDRHPVLVVEKSEETGLQVYDRARWTKILEANA